MYTSDYSLYSIGNGVLRLISSTGMGTSEHRDRFTYAVRVITRCSPAACSELYDLMLKDLGYADNPLEPIYETS